MFARVLFLFVLLVSAPSLAYPDPPARAGRLSVAEGAVSWRADYSAAPYAARVNWPVTSANTIATGAGSRAEIRVGSTSLRLGPHSELEVKQLDDEQLSFRLLHGSAAVVLASAEHVAQFSLWTPEGMVRPLTPGSYRIDTRSGITWVKALRGRAMQVSDGGEAVIDPGQQVALAGNPATIRSRTGAQLDDFDRWSAAREARITLAEPSHVSPEMTGYEDLAGYGQWQETDDYGFVWYPYGLPVGWAPYRGGNWTWVAPWGWTWIDHAPWGFAPFHYGRWVQLHRRWAWVPGDRIARPVFSPGLVAWIGRPGLSITFSSGTLPATAWAPLGPHDVFIPSHHASKDFVHRLNQPHARFARQSDGAERRFAAQASDGAWRISSERPRMRDRTEFGHDQHPARLDAPFSAGGRIARSRDVDHARDRLQRDGFSAGGDRFDGRRDGWRRSGEGSGARFDSGSNASATSGTGGMWAAPPGSGSHGPRGGGRR